MASTSAGARTSSAVERLAGVKASGGQVYRGAGTVSGLRYKSKFYLLRNFLLLINYPFCNEPSFSCIMYIVH